uniref:Bromo domain-containing protein n=1 Tax=Rhabditophanes sp. KR3021 TaxID=114890 RepID=A0AC35UBV5_9BILA
MDPETSEQPPNAEENLEPAVMTPTDEVVSTPTSTIKRRGRPPLDPSLRKSAKRKALTLAAMTPRNLEKPEGGDKSVGEGMSSTNTTAKRERKRTKKADSSPGSTTPARTLKRKKERKPVEDKRIKLDEEEKPPKVTSEVIEEVVEPQIINVKPNYYTFSAFQLFCNAILRKLSKKDPEEYFAYPVSVADAPEYDKIITQPMDFQSILIKIEKNQYAKIQEMSYDVNLIAENAMTYNPPTSIYHFAAVKLQGIAKYYFSTNYLAHLRYTLSFGKEVTNEQIGVPPIQRQPLPVSRPKNAVMLRNSLVDDMDGKRLANIGNGNTRLSTTVPRLEGRMAFMDNKGGATTLNIISERDVDRKSHTLGDLVGRLEKGTPGLIASHEPLAHARVPVSYFNYGAFTSFAPQYDSTWASMSKKDCDMFYNCYGSRENTDLSFDILNTVAGCDEVYDESVNGMIDAITNNDHSVTTTLFKKCESKVDKADVDVFAGLSDEELLQELMSLENLGMDVNGLRDIQTSIGAKPLALKSPSELQDQGSMLLADLNYLQHKRLSMNPSITLSHGIEPSCGEIHLADKVLNNLSTQISQFAVPEDLVKPESLHNAMSIEDGGDLEYLCF